MGNEQSGQHRSGPRYVLALMTEAILPRTDNYILNQLGEWAAQQTRLPIACALDTTNSNGIDEDDEDDGVQIISEDLPPPRTSVRRQWNSLDSVSSRSEQRISFGSLSTCLTTVRIPKEGRLTASPLPSARERSRYASYHKPPQMGNMDRGTYLEVLKRKMPNMYKKQTVS